MVEKYITFHNVLMKYIYILDQLKITQSSSQDTVRFYLFLTILFLCLPNNFR